MICANPGSGRDGDDTAENVFGVLRAPRQEMLMLLIHIDHGHFVQTPHALCFS